MCNLILPQKNGSTIKLLFDKSFSLKDIIHFMIKKESVVYNCLVESKPQKQQSVYYKNVDHSVDQTTKGSERKSLKAFYVVVPRDRIELPTRGFSVPCSTD